MSPLIRSVVAVAMAALSFSAIAVPVAGDIAIIQRNTSSDTFAFAALMDIAANQRIFFTDKGWQTSGSFRGSSATGGHGVEELMYWTALTPITAGTIISSGSTMDTRWQWTTSGAIPGTSANYSTLKLAEVGDQIYAFLAETPNPLHSVTTHLYVLDDTGVFENATSTATGDAPNALIEGTTALTLSMSGAANGNIGVKADILAVTRSADEWLAVFSLPSSWTNAPYALPSAIGVTPETAAGPSGGSAVPEPPSVWLLSAAALASASMRTRLCRVGRQRSGAITSAV